MGDKKYSFGILLLVLLAWLGGRGQFESSSCLAHEDAAGEGDQIDIIETIAFKDVDGIEHEEYAFREPARGLPTHVLNMFCSSVRVRLYWDVFRDEIKQTARKGLYLRRMARLAKHIFEELRDVDKPFNATQLSVVDEYMSADELDSGEDKKLDETINETSSSSSSSSGSSPSDAKGDPDTTADGGATSKSFSSVGTNSFKALKGLKEKITKKLSPSDKSTKQPTSVENTADGEHEKQQEDTAADQLSSNDLISALEKQGPAGEAATSRLKQFLAKPIFKKVAMGVYTRWRTMWWMMMSCLFAKYYLWDPALEEFLKLKRTLLMWPELQLAKMHQLKCKPLMFFRRVMDICKILNPLMRIDFGQFNLEKLTRFKSDQN